MFPKQQIQVLRNIQRTLDQLIKLIEAPLPSATPVRTQDKPPRRRTPAEVKKLKKEVTALRKRGLTCAQIAQRLNITAAYVSLLVPGKDILPE